MTADRGGAVEKTVKISYYAILREQSGTSEEVVKTAAVTVADLYAEVRSRHDFSLPKERMSVAVDDEFVTWERELADRDHVVFVPPVAGG